MPDNRVDELRAAYDVGCEMRGCTERCIGHVNPPSTSKLPPILYVCREHARQVSNMWNRIYGLPERPATAE